MKIRPVVMLAGFGAIAALACGNRASDTTSGSARARTACKTTANCESACDAGDAVACTTAAERYFEGKNEHSLDHARAFALAKRACDGNSSHGCALLGFHHQDGLGTAWAPEAAVAAYTKGCQLGAGVACFNLATIYEGHGIAADPARAKEYFDRAREQWNKQCAGDEPRWCTNAAYMVSRQSGNQPSTADLERMLALDVRTCEAGVLVGCVETLLVREDLKRIGKPELEAELATLCKNGEPTACMHLGMRELADKNARGVATLQRGCAIGDKQSCYLSAMEALRGELVAQDYAAAERYFHQACDRVHGMSCGILAQKLAREPSRFETALRLAERGCQMGYADACAHRATLRTDDVTQWARAGCSSGSLDSCRMLLERGVDLPLPASEITKVHDALCREGRAASCGKATP